MKFLGAHRQTVRVVYYVSLSLLLFALQSVGGRVFPSLTLLLLPSLVVFAPCFERIVPSVIVAFLCGLETDVFSTVPSGLFTLLFTLFAVAQWFAMRYVLRRGLRVFFIFDFLLIAISFTVYLISAYSSAGLSAAVPRLLPYYLPGLLLSVAAGALIYICSRTVCLRFADDPGEY